MNALRRQNSRPSWMMNTEDTRFTKVRQNVSKRLEARQKCVDTNAISKNLAYWLHRTPNNAQITSNAIIKYTVIKWWHGRVEWLWQKTGYHIFHLSDIWVSTCMNGYDYYYTAPGFLFVAVLMSHAKKIDKQKRNTSVKKLPPGNLLLLW